MEIIKTVSELKAGDILVGLAWTEVVVHVGPSSEPGWYILATARFSQEAGCVAHCSTWEGTNRRVVVVHAASVPELTPAQQAADKLLDAAERCFQQLQYVQLDRDGTMYKLRSDLQVLLPTLRPKPAPTLDEALTVLRNLFDVTHSYDAAKSAHSAARALFARVPPSFYINFGDGTATKTNGYKVQRDDGDDEADAIQRTRVPK